MTIFDCTAYGKFGRFCRYSFHTTNFLCSFTCLTAIVYGSWVLYRKKIFAALFQPTLYVACAFVLVIIGILAVAAAFVAFYAATRELRCLMYTFAVANVILFVMLIIGSIMGFVFQFQLKRNALDVQLLATLQNFYGQPNHNDVTLAWNYLQEQLSCCGVKNNNEQNFMIWRTSKWHMDYEGVPKKHVPLSCCTKNDNSAYVNETECQFVDLQNPNDDVIFMKGCHGKLYDDLIETSTTEAIIGITASILLLFSAFFSALLASLIQK